MAVRCRPFFSFPSAQRTVLSVNQDHTRDILQIKPGNITILHQSHVGKPGANSPQLRICKQQTISRTCDISAVCDGINSMKALMCAGYIQSLNVALLLNSDTNADDAMPKAQARETTALPSITAAYAYHAPSAVS